MYNAQRLPGTPMTSETIAALLKQPILVVNNMQWTRTGGGECSVAEYEGIIQGEKVFLHLMSIETSNYWIVTWPERGLKPGKGIHLSEYDLSSITKNAKSALQRRLTKD